MNNYSPKNPFDEKWYPIDTTSSVYRNFVSQNQSVIDSYERINKEKLSIIQSYQEEINSCNNRKNQLSCNNKLTFKDKREIKKLSKNILVIEQKVKQISTSLVGKYDYEEAIENLSFVKKCTKQLDNDLAKTFIDQIEDNLEYLLDIPCKEQSWLLEKILKKVQALEAVKHPYWKYYYSAYCYLVIDNYAMPEELKEKCKEIKREKVLFSCDDFKKYSRFRLYTSDLVSDMAADMTSKKQSEYHIEIVPVVNSGEVLGLENTVPGDWD